MSYKLEITSKTKFHVIAFDDTKVNYFDVSHEFRELIYFRNNIAVTKEIMSLQLLSKQHFDNLYQILE